MRIGIQFAGDLPMEIAEKCFESIRKYMDCPIVHMTDLKTPKFPFADEVQRIDEDRLVEARYKHLSTIEGDCLSLDYDTIVRRDVSDVFKKRFDVCLTKRTADDDRRRMLHLISPHNLGVIFTRNKDFWKVCLGRLLKYPEKGRWMSGQTCVTECADIFKGRFNIKELPASLYNYTPKSRSEDVSNKYIVHYKGHRKHWMADTQRAYDEGIRVSEMSLYPMVVTKEHPNLQKILEEDQRRKRIA